MIDKVKQDEDISPRVDKRRQGRANRLKGARFELKVRKHLESKGWVVDRWSNNVEFKSHPQTMESQEIGTWGELIKAKSFMGKTRSNGFPDFIAFRTDMDIIKEPFTQVNGVEVKINGYMDKVEKEKAQWLLKNKIFGKFFVASKGGVIPIVFREVKLE